MADKLIYIPNDDTHNYPLCRLQLVVEAWLNTQVDEPTYSNSIKVPKKAKPTNRRTLLYLWGLV